MRHIFFATAATAVLVAIGAFPDRAGAADVGGPPPGYGPPSVYGPPSSYGPPPRPPHAIPYAVSPIRPVCDRQWRCGPWGCGWRRVCYPAQPSVEHYATPYRGYAYRGYGPPTGPGYYGPY